MTISIFFLLIMIVSFPFIMNPQHFSQKFLIASGVLSLTIAWTSVIMILLLFIRVAFLIFWG
jgi:hypothetical protein